MAKEFWQNIWIQLCKYSSGIAMFKRRLGSCVQYHCCACLVDWRSLSWQTSARLCLPVFDAAQAERKVRNIQERFKTKASSGWWLHSVDASAVPIQAAWQRAWDAPNCLNV